MSVVSLPMTLPLLSFVSADVFRLTETPVANDGASLADKI